MHYALRGGFGAAKVHLRQVKENKPWCDLESREKERDRVEASKDDLDEDGDRHGGVRSFLIRHHPRASIDPLRLHYMYNIEVYLRVEKSLPTMYLSLEPRVREFDTQEVRE